MAGVLATAVVVHTDGGPVWLEAGSTPAPEHAALITNPAAWAEGEAPAVAVGEPTGAERKEPPRSGPGSNAEAWRAYATGMGLTVQAGLSRDEIIAAVDAHQAAYGDA